MQYMIIIIRSHSTYTLDNFEIWNEFIESFIITLSALMLCIPLVTDIQVARMIVPFNSYIWPNEDRRGMGYMDMRAHLNEELDFVDQAKEATEDLIELH